VEASLNLACQAVKAGVKRFIFLSSIKVNGEQSPAQRPFSSTDNPDPCDAYAHSKLEAEKGLAHIAQIHALEVVILRPAMVYGSGCGGNFPQLVKLVKSRIPLPFERVHNRRAFIGIQNLISVIRICITHPRAPEKVLLVTDGEDISTPELLRRIGAAAGVRVHLFAFPTIFLEAGARLIRCHSVAQRLIGSLEVDIEETRTALEWKPPVQMEEELKRFCAPKSPSQRQWAKALLFKGLDIAGSSFGLVAGLPLFISILVLGWFDTGSPLFRQERVGREQRPFMLLKFRTMKLDTASVASHLADPASITRFGRVLRRTKLDELPQLWNVLKGDMSLVGPRPCLFCQHDLIAARAERGIFNARPGITGLAQIRGIDMSTPELLAQTDAKMLDHLGIKNYFRYIFMTLKGKGGGDRVKT
jgi:lipopolysaccharide/colanic/teichoic acid biosynthesis glycosyltransferase